MTVDTVEQQYQLNEIVSVICLIISECSVVPEYKLYYFMFDLQPREGTFSHYLKTVFKIRYLRQ